MSLNQFWNRRGFLGGFLGSLSAVLGGGVAVAKAPSDGKVPPPAKLTGFGSSGDVYAELGVTPVINADATMTTLGGSLMSPEVETVMAEAARHFVSIPALNIAAGNRIAQMLKLDDIHTAVVTGGAAAALQSGLAGILTGDNEQFIRQLPDLTGMKSEVIIQKSHRYAFDHQLRATGIKFVEIETVADLEKAVNSQTAMMHFANWLNPDGQIKVDEWPRLAKKHNLPCFNDAAADVPPVSHLWDYINMGYDLVTFSGGKAMRGPQCAGLLIGRKDLIRYATLNTSPYEDVLGRASKVGKEEIVGMVKALELFMQADHDALATEWSHRLQSISGKIAGIPGIQTSFFEPEIANHFPTMRVTWDQAKIPMSPKQVGQALRDGKPSISVGMGEDGIEITTFLLKPGEEKIVGEQLAAVLKQRPA
ncbi:MAG TPA: aminotransferase class V-fold PLP-dependent enzyme [Bryobacteraceae bacterium]|nr:aminotransferase class V-fold PLP-dependent enzyme [Bryobacteraceae bacterium]